MHNAPDLILIRANQKYLNFMEGPYRKIENSIGTMAKDRIPGFETSVAEEIFSNVIKTGETYYANEFKYDHFERGVTHWNSSLVPIFIEGKVKYIIEIYIEFTERVPNKKFVEEQAKVIEQKDFELEAIIENMTDAIILCNEEGNSLRANKAARGLFDGTYVKIDNDIYFKDEVEFIDIDKKTVNFENLPTNRVIRGEKILGYKLGIKNKESVIYVDINGTPLYDSNGDYLVGILNVRDVSEKLKYQKLLQQQYELFYQIIDNFDLPVFRLSVPDLIVLDLNQKAYKLATSVRSEITSINELVGKKILDNKYDFFYKNEYDQILKAIKEKRTEYIKEREYIADGNIGYGNIIIEPLITINGEMKELIVIMIDITSEVKAAKDMEETLQLQEEFLANISHELRTPINVIFTAIQMLEYNIRAKGKDESGDIKYVKMMKQNSYRLLKLVNNIIDISKIESGYFNVSLSNNNIISIVEEITLSVSEYAKSKGVTIIFDTDVEEKIIACDPDIIERIMLNLISNALKFTSKKDKIYVNLKNQGEKISIEVIDTGIGIPEDKQKMIFERFKQADKSFAKRCEGSGIGLSLVKLLVEALGGTICVKSVVNQGSKFFIELPAMPIDDIGTNYAMDISSIPRNVDRIRIEFSDIYS